jgi:hypothetical protein
MAAAAAAAAAAGGAARSSAGGRILPAPSSQLAELSDHSGDGGRQRKIFLWRECRTCHFFLPLASD